MGGKGISGDYEREKVSTCTAGSCVLIWPNGKLRVCACGMWQVAGARWQAAKKGFTTRKTSCQGAGQSCEASRRGTVGELSSLVAMAQASL